LIISEETRIKYLMAEIAGVSSDEREHHDDFGNSNGEVTEPKVAPFIASDHFSVEDLAIKV
jgi:hypothetical protein